jgi:hypothetical protein
VDVFTGAPVRSPAPRVEDLFGRLPVALLVKKRGS